MSASVDSAAFRSSSESLQETKRFGMPSLEEKKGYNQWRQSLRVGRLDWGGGQTQYGLLPLATIHPWLNRSSLVCWRRITLRDAKKSEGHNSDRFLCLGIKSSRQSTLQSLRCLVSTHQFCHFP